MAMTPSPSRRLRTGSFTFNTSKRIEGLFNVVKNSVLNETRLLVLLNNTEPNPDEIQA